MATTLADLELGARRRADVVSSSFVTSNELTRWANQAGRELHGELVQLSEDHVTSPHFTYFSITGSASLYALPTDWMKMRRLETKHSDRWVRMQRTTLESVHSLQSPEQTTDSARRYLIFGRTLMLIPSGSAAGDYRMMYVQRWTDLSAQSDTVPTALDDYSDYIEVTMAMKAKDKGSEDTSTLVGERNAILSRVRREASTLDIGEPTSVGEYDGGVAFDPDEPWG